MITISERLKEKLKQIPSLPGIYKMLDSHKTIIYIGKSKCLKKRVNSYFTKNHSWEKIKKMVGSIDDIEIVVTDTHLEARLLECELIKTHKPMFNAQMKHDGSYVYLKLEEYNAHRAISVIHQRDFDSFGPFRRKFALDVLMKQLHNIYPLSQSYQTLMFDYHIFPVDMDKETFMNNRTILMKLFTEDSMMDLFLHQLEENMKEAASIYKYETASYYRDLLQGFTYLKKSINGYHELFTVPILLKLPLLDGIKLFYVSQGQIVRKEIFPSLNDKELRSFLRKCKSAKLSTTLPYDEKAGIDYRDILYSEILSLPEDSVLYL
ncbi:MAG: Excinuclease subunit domain protein [Herbinix sp.]|jgi:excinuclease ABC subunit C|nr:Excinuclease subunit domain protein [Herbinix sp.]